jgi:hypothetical protein
MQGSLKILHDKGGNPRIELINPDLLLQEIMDEFNVKRDVAHIFYFQIKSTRSKNRHLAYIHADLLPRLRYVLHDAGWEIFSLEKAKDWLKLQMGYYEKIEVNGETFTKIRSLADASEQELIDFINYGNQVIGELS